MSTKAERFRAEQERSGVKKIKRPERRERSARPGRGDASRILESSRTRGQDIRVSRPPKRTR